MQVVNTGNEGIYWLERIKEINREISVVMITAYGDIEMAVKALQSGASDFVLKPWDNEKTHSNSQTCHSAKPVKEGGNSFERERESIEKRT